MAEDLREFYVALQKELSEEEYLKGLEPEFQVLRLNGRGNAARPCK